MTGTIGEIVQKSALGFLNLTVVTSQILLVSTLAIGIFCLLSLIAIKIRNCYVVQQYRVTPAPDAGRLYIII